MWVLLIVILNVVTGKPERSQVLERYDTKDACAREQVRIVNEMEKAYPGEDDFSIICRFTGGTPI